jgi:selenide, water dikinase
MQDIKLTQYSHGAGCGCKISPKVLDEILKSSMAKISFPNLLVGNESKDDAAVYDMGNGEALISTTDFFMPIVDSAFDFGRIASVNAISDVYAMGGEPIMAIAILGFPIDKLPAEVAQQILEGSRAVCAEAKIPLAGKVKIEHLKQNSTATEGCHLYLTKPLGVGILTTAHKKGALQENQLQAAINQMTKLNEIGAKISHLSSVKAMTDVTGFGLLGHLIEICEGSGLSAEIEFDKIPQLPEIADYLESRFSPGGCKRNWDSYGEKVAEVTEKQRILLADPQTSGGLLIAVEESGKGEVEKILSDAGIRAVSFGKMIKNQEKRVLINN